MAVKGLKRNIFQRILGICVTKPPVDAGCWVAAQGTITVNLAAAPELSPKGGAIRLEGKGLPRRVLLFRDDAGVLRALENRCAQGPEGRSRHRRGDPPVLQRQRRRLRVLGQEDRGARRGAAQDARGPGGEGDGDRHVGVAARGSRRNARPAQR